MDLEFSHKLYHAGELEQGYQQSMTEAPFSDRSSTFKPFSLRSLQRSDGNDTTT
jgi:hypothetical protein